MLTSYGVRGFGVAYNGRGVAGRFFPRDSGAARIVAMDENPYQAPRMEGGGRPKGDRLWRELADWLVLFVVCVAAVFLLIVVAAWLGNTWLTRGLP